MKPLATLTPDPAGVLDPSAVETPEIDFLDPGLERVWGRVVAGERLGHADGMACLETWDLPALGMMADHVARRRHGDKVYFVLNRQLNPTNICVLDCGFCDFAARPRNDPKAYEMDWDEILAHVTDDIREIHIVGGLHHRWPYEKYVEIVRRIREKSPTITIKAWTAVEIDFFAKIGKRSIERVLEDMVEAGLDALPGGGAEVFSTAVRATIAERKLTGEEWLRVHREAHELGIPTNCTMLYGHVETAEDRVAHLGALRGLQDETGGFLTYIPLAYHPDHNELGEELGRTGTATTGYEDLKNIAVGRLFLDNIPHVKTHWPMVTPFLSQIALSFGCDDVEGTVVYERIYHEAGAQTAMHMSYLELVRLIRGAGKRPVERDSLYRELRDQFDDPPPEPSLRRGAALPVVHAA